MQANYVTDEASHKYAWRQFPNSFSFANKHTENKKKNNKTTYMAMIVPY